MGKSDNLTPFPTIEPEYKIPGFGEFQYHDFQLPLEKSVLRLCWRFGNYGIYCTLAVFLYSDTETAVRLLREGVM